MQLAASFNKGEVELLFSKKGIKILVIGDLMLDAYINGKVERMSPEAPVPIVNYDDEEFRIGGAGNVAINLKALGAEPVLIGIKGNDKEGKILEDLFTEAGLSINGIVTSSTRPTTLKTRIMDKGKQLLRLDKEETSTLIPEDRHTLLERIKTSIQGVNFIIIEDYEKGVLDETNIQQIIGWAKEQNIPIAVDPKKNNFHFYTGENITLFKPNLRELAEAEDKPLSASSSIDDIEMAAEQFLKKSGVKNLLLTLSEKGMFAADQNNSLHIPAHRRNIVDVSGAGDTVIAVAAFVLAAGGSFHFAASLANLAGGYVCEKQGVVSISADDLLEEITAIMFYDIIKSE